MLIIGIKTRWAAIVLAFFMVSITFGHLMMDHYETIGDISMYGYNNLACIFLVLWYDIDQFKYSVDDVINGIGLVMKWS